MDPLELAQAFLEQCERSRSIERLRRSFQRALECLGFCRFVCSSHVDLLHPPLGAVVMHNYPIEWLSAYSARRFHEVDPLFLYAERTPLPFFWDDRAFRASLSPSQQEIMESADTLGLAHGYTVPIHLPLAAGGQRASCSVVPGAAPASPRSYLAVRLMAPYVYETARRLQHSKIVRGGSIELTRREWQCLELAACGKSDGAMAQVLGLSESTVHKHIERAKRRLGVATRVQAIVAALMSRQLRIDRRESEQGADNMIFADSHKSHASTSFSFWTERNRSIHHDPSRSRAYHGAADDGHGLSRA